MNKKSFWQTANLTKLSDKARRFFEESDGTALDGLFGLFGNCNSIEDIEKVANDLYDEFFGDTNE